MKRIELGALATVAVLGLVASAHAGDLAVGTYSGQISAGVAGQVSAAVGLNVESIDPSGAVKGTWTLTGPAKFFPCHGTRNLVGTYAGDKLSLATPDGSTGPGCELKIRFKVDGATLTTERGLVLKR